MGAGGKEPVPDRAITGLVAALVARSMLADLAPALVGVNVTLTLHDCPAATMEPQLLVSANIAAGAPPTLIPRMVRFAPPVFESVMICAVADVPMTCALNVRAPWSTLTAGAGGGPPEPPLPPPPLLPVLSGFCTTSTPPEPQPPHNARIAARAGKPLVNLVILIRAPEPEAFP